MLALLVWSCQSPRTVDRYNLNFEQPINSGVNNWRAINRTDSSRYKVSLDSAVAKEGKYAAAISFEGGLPDRTGWVYTINDTFKGDSIMLTGYVKTQNVMDGQAALWLKVSSNGAYDDMHKRGLKGTNDWTKCSITLPLSSETETKIVFGGMLRGRGKMWMDDLKITIDGKDISSLTPIEKLPADKDYAFDLGDTTKIGALDEDKINHLYHLGLIWGYLKYHHPAIIQGKYNWDYELIRILPKFLNAAKNEKDALLRQWIHSMGALGVGTANDNRNNDSVTIKPDLSWITTSGFSKDLISLLQKTGGVNGICDKQYYVAKTALGNPVFKNERAYDNFPYPADGFRILALFRYWNLVQYFFPYRNIMGEDWKIVLKRFIPKFLNAQNELEYQLTALELAAHTGDGHAFFNYHEKINRYFGANYLPVKLRFIENKLVVTGLDQGPSIKDDIRLGDVISKIGTISVEKKIEMYSKYFPAPNKAAQLRYMAEGLVSRTNDSIVNVEVIRDGKRLNKTVHAYGKDKLKFEKFSFYSKSYKWINHTIGYIDNSTLKKADLESMFTQFQHAKGLIIDLRNYPAENLMQAVPDYLLSEPKAFVKMSAPDFCRPGSFYFRSAEKTGNEHKGLFKGILVLLIDETTQSASEYHAMAYSTYPNCVIIGNNSAGTDGMVSEFSLPGNLKTRFSGVGIYYPDGKPTQRVGIQPHIMVKPTIQDIRNKRDIVLDRAIEYCKKKYRK
ncbi:S41 family peptidase [Niabella yanshanensis]|uniref:S41 family peptidase n=1 Tax=Niabella yanshanensis TaxID=577386 RepID=A0ABZ0W8R8_9BACT|nr:S41 family peptidase [Niabella yanshanensis]WQD38892.1 S41 family peptidase [Niabella yanshanensis]